MRSAGDGETRDAAVDEAATGLTATLDFFASVLSRRSYDGEGAEVVATVHYGRDYDNAFWNGDQLVFGDGDGKVFGRFTRSLDVLGHELGHAVTQYSEPSPTKGSPGRSTSRCPTSSAAWSSSARRVRRPLTRTG